MTELVLSLPGVDLCVRTCGSPEDPTLLLVGGAASSMDWWDPELRRRLADAGRHVVAYDARDTGRSTTGRPGAPAYTSEDLTTDPLRVLDGLGIASAQLVGISMGGAIAYSLAVRFPDRVTALALLSTTHGADGLPPPASRVARGFEHPAPDPDWSDREAVLDRAVADAWVFAGGLGVDEDDVRRAAGAAYDRSSDPAAAANHWLLAGGDDSEEDVSGRLSEIVCPTVVVHGSEDPLFPLEHGRSLAAAIPGARLVVVPGMGHQVPPRSTWDLVVPALLAVGGPP